MFGYDGSSRVPLQDTCIGQVDRQGMNVAWQHTIMIGLTVSGLPRNKHPRIGMCFSLVLVSDTTGIHLSRRPRLTT